MSDIILLDSGPLGLISHPRFSAVNQACTVWLAEQLQRERRVLIPAIIDYEMRRELLRGGKLRGLANLNGLKKRLGGLPLTSSMLLHAAELWAQARRLGKPTASDAALDVDVILAAQAIWLQNKGYQVIVATTNINHLELFVDARHWSDIA